jgi:hypothetical protein
MPSKRMTCPDGELNTRKCRTDFYGSPCYHLGEHDERETCTGCSCGKLHSYCPECVEVKEEVE